jgi:transposase
MTMLAELVDGVIGVDTHRDTLTAAAVTNLGGVLAQTTTSADAAGYQQLLGFADHYLRGRRLWAVEEAGSFGTGLTAVLYQRGERVVEVGGPSGQPVAVGPRATRWTRFGPLARCSVRSARPPRAAAGSGRHCGRC